MNPRWPLLLLLAGCPAPGDTDPEEPDPDIDLVMPEVPPAELPFRMGATGQRGTGYTQNGATSLPTLRHLLEVTATDDLTFVVFPPEERDGRQGLDIAWAGYDRPWVRAPLLDTAWK